MNPFHTLKGQLGTALDNSGIKFAVGGFDISLNEHEAGAFSPHWKPHASLFIHDAYIRVAGAWLRAHFPKEKSAVPSPVKTYAWDGNLRAIAYALKGNFHRRITLASTTNAEGQRQRRNVRYRDLKAEQKVELLIALNRIGLYRRLFLHGAELVVDDDEDDVLIGKPSEK
jgi:hypothetical protein